MTGPDGIARMIGATPTMYPGYFLTENSNGETTAGWVDLAPDDISGISWLYPREDGQDKFFSISQEARTPYAPRHRHSLIPHLRRAHRGLGQREQQRG